MNNPIRLQLLTLSAAAALALASSPASALADWVIVTSQAIRPADLVPGTNEVVLKVRAGNYRRDMGTNETWLLSAGKADAVRLFHATRTYCRFPAGDTNSGLIPPQFLPVGEQLLGDNQARVFIWTNASEQGRLWVLPVIAVSGGDTNLLASFALATNVTPNQGVGSLFDRDSIVAASEVSTGTRPLMPSGSARAAARPASVPDGVMITTRLLSISLTNLSPAEFQIPANYSEVPPQNFASAPPAALLDRVKAASGMLSVEAMNALHKEYEQGRPILTMPPPVSPGGK